MARFSIAIGNDHGRRIGYGQKSRQPNILLIRVQVDGAFDMSGVEVGLVPGVSKNSLFFFKAPQRVIDGNFSDTTLLRGLWDVAADTRSRNGSDLIRPDRIYDQSDSEMYLSCAF